MADNPVTENLPADLPVDWVYGQTVAPTGAEAGLAGQYGYNYLMEQVNAAQRAVLQIAGAFEGLPTITQVFTTLTVSGWSGTPLRQTVAVPGASVTAAGSVAPSCTTDAGRALWVDCGIFALQMTADGQLTFQAESKPTGDIPIVVEVTRL